MLVFGCLWWGGALNTGSGRHSVGTGGQWLRSLRQPGVAPQPRVNLYPSTLRICLEVLRVHAKACAPSWYPTCFSMPTGSRETIGCGTVLFRVADLFVCGCSARVRGGRHRRGTALSFYSMPAASLPRLPVSIPTPHEPRQSHATTTTTRDRRRTRPRAGGRSRPPPYPPPPRGRQGGHPHRARGVSHTG